MREDEYLTDEEYLKKVDEAIEQVKEELRQMPYTLYINRRKYNKRERIRDTNKDIRSIVKKVFDTILFLIAVGMMLVCPPLYFYWRAVRGSER